jgi:hypothetical protein
MTQSHPKFKKLTETESDTVEDILTRALKQLSGIQAKATVQLRVLPVGNAHKKTVHTIAVTPGGVFLHKEEPGKKPLTPTLVVITTSEAFHSMADGSYSPVEAYHDGKMELLGDADLARQIIAHLSKSGD